MQATGARPKITVTGGGKGVVGHAGTRLLVELAETTGLTQFGDVLTALRQRDSGHDPGRVAVDVAVMIADGGEAIADLAVLRGEAELFGPVASDATAWRVRAGIDGPALGRLRAARAADREVAWAQRYETRGGLPASMAADRPVPGLVAARITRSARRTRLRIAAGWPWANDLVTAFTRLTALPRPAT